MRGTQLACQLTLVNTGRLNQPHGARIMTGAAHSWGQRGVIMINLDDMENMCDLTRDDIAEVADHEHLGAAAAVAEVERLMQTHGGPQKVQKMICDDIRTALHADNVAKAQRLFAI